MIKLYFNNITTKEYLLLIFPILIAPIVMGTQGIYLDTILYSHYITLVPNIIFIMFCYKQYYKINVMYNIIVTRIGSFKTFTISVFFGVGITILYSAILYLYLATFLRFPYTMNMKITFIYICISIFIYLSEQIIMTFQLGNKKNVLYILIPVTINFIFHYYFVPLYFI